VAVERLRARVALKIRERCPGYRATVGYPNGVVNGPSDQASRELLGAATARGLLADHPPARHPHVAAWPAAHSSFRSKPSRFPCSAEALLRRAAHGGVPPVNRLVDCTTL
jgi:DNA/RNA-binding domain of Phe-tRNA-synthetase-like protein